MGFLIIIGFGIYIIIRKAYEDSKPYYPEITDWKKLQEDRTKVTFGEMSAKQLDRNWKNGVYSQKKTNV